MYYLYATIMTVVMCGYGCLPEPCITRNLLIVYIDSGSHGGDLCQYTEQVSMCVERYFDGRSPLAGVVVEWHSGGITGQSDRVSGTRVSNLVQCRSDRRGVLIHELLHVIQRDYDPSHKGWVWTLEQDIYTACLGTTGSPLPVTDSAFPTLMQYRVLPALGEPQYQGLSTQTPQSLGVCGSDHLLLLFSLGSGLYTDPLFLRGSYL